MKIKEGDNIITIEKSQVFSRYILSGFLFVLGILKFIFPANFSDISIFVPFIFILGSIVAFAVSGSFIIEFDNDKKIVNVSIKRLLTKKASYNFSEIKKVKLKQDDPLARRLVFGYFSGMMLLTFILKSNKEINFSLGNLKSQFFIGNKNYIEWSKVLDKIHDLTGLEIEKENNTYYS